MRKLWWLVLVALSLALLRELVWCYVDSVEDETEVIVRERFKSDQYTERLVRHYQATTQDSLGSTVP